MCRAIVPWPTHSARFCSVAGPGAWSAPGIQHDLPSKVRTDDRLAIYARASGAWTVVYHRAERHSRPRHFSAGDANRRPTAVDLRF